MATAKGPLFSLQASGSIGGALTYTKDGRVRSHGNQAKPKTPAQIEAHLILGDVSRELRQLGMAVRTQECALFGGRWRNKIHSFLQKKRHVYWGLYEELFYTFTFEQQFAWSLVDPGLGLAHAQGMTFFIVAKGLYYRTLMENYRKFIPEPMPDNADLIRQAWVY